MSFEHISVRKNLFLRESFCWESRLSLPEMDLTKNIKLVEPLVVVTLTWISYFVFSKYLDYMQYCTMLLEQCGRKVVKVQATVTWLDEKQILVCLVTWRDYYFAFT